MDFHPSADELRIRDIARSYAAEILAAHADSHAHGAFPTERMPEMGERGLLGLKLAPARGGLGGSTVAWVLALREIAEVCASTAVAVAVTNMVAEMIDRFGDDDQKDRWLPEITSGRFLAASFALSEADAGSDAAALSTRAVRQVDGSYRLSGTKMWITSGDVAGVVLLMAKTDPSAGAHGITTFLVDPRAAGFQVGRQEAKLGLRGSTTVSLTLDNVAVPACDVLGDEGLGFRIAMTALDGGRCSIGAQAVGIGHAALRSVVQRLDHERRSVDRAAGISQMQDFRIAEMATSLEAAWWLTLRAAWLKDTGRRMSREAAMAKVMASEAADEVCRKAVEVLGPAALAADDPVSRRLRDVRVTRIYEGTSQVQRIVIARELIRAQGPT